MKHHDQPGVMVADLEERKKVFKMLMGPQPAKAGAGRTPV
jgi:hypothetical protein